MRTLSKAALVAAVSLTTVLGVTTAAQADTTFTGVNYAGVYQTTADGSGLAQVDWTTGTKTAPAFAHAYIENSHTGYSLNGWLERSTDGGKTWYTVSGVNALNNGSVDSTVQTYDYYDGPGYLARACFQFTSWSGAAVHCSPAI
ncbi:hypothetical protein [Streptacidiphilus fuscans]|uniref:Uncharacterized protein n=1 Tax=Streptacidiphilus fuscans TaxID=2789292 RepID=A0A931B4Y6_9ACTN|nr:hypothetical protein [Streptacidiphilus fuscans]MBF9069076.1 hypothetical protein [Streptacidiphilus fuscans]